jgi:hypothetical protein
MTQEFQIELVMMFDDRDEAARAVQDLEEEEDVVDVALNEFNTGRSSVNATVLNAPVGPGVTHEDLLDYCKGRYGHVLSTADRCWSVMVRREKSA